MFKTRLDTDTHSPSQARFESFINFNTIIAIIFIFEFRVNVALSNFKEFAQHFHCKPGTKMNPNPRNRCTVW
jgi:predicted metalloendopeptidase